MRLEPAPRVDDAPVVLRPLEHADVDDWYAYLSVPSVVEHTSWSVGGRDELAALVDDCTSDAKTSGVRFAIVDGADGSLVGSIGFPLLSWPHRTAEVAYDLKPSAWGRGIATACCRALTGWALDERGFVRIQATALDTNTASRRVLEKSGFLYEGTLRKLKRVRGTSRDFLLYARTKEL